MLARESTRPLCADIGVVELAGGILDDADPVGQAARLGSEDVLVPARVSRSCFACFRMPWIASTSADAGSSENASTSARASRTRAGAS